jgi:deazaflavin-dependent oxidoreductase (nitroreductase family)
MTRKRLFTKPFERDQAYRREPTFVKAATEFASLSGWSIVRHMKLKDGSSIVADLATVGRKTGQPRTVELRLLCYQGSFYATSSRIKGKHWCENLIQNPSVEIKARGERFTCIAKQVTDEALHRRILELRDTPPDLDRVVFEIKPQ